MSHLKNIARWRHLTRAVRAFSPILFEARYAYIIRRFEKAITEATNTLNSLLSERVAEEAYFTKLANKFKEVIETTDRYLEQGDAISAYQNIQGLTAAADRCLKEREEWERDYLHRFAEADLRAERIVRQAYRSVGQVELTRDEITQLTSSFIIHLTFGPKAIH